MKEKLDIKGTVIMSLIALILCVISFGVYVKREINIDDEISRVIEYDASMVDVLQSGSATDIQKYLCDTVRKEHTITGKFLVSGIVVEDVDSPVMTIKDVNSGYSKKVRIGLEIEELDSIKAQLVRLGNDTKNYSDRKSIIEKDLLQFINNNYTYVDVASVAVSDDFNSALLIHKDGTLGYKIL